MYVYTYTSIQTITVSEKRHHEVENKEGYMGHFRGRNGNIEILKLYYNLKKFLKIIESKYFLSFGMMDYFYYVNSFPWFSLKVQCHTTIKWF